MIDKLHDFIVGAILVALVVLGAGAFFSVIFGGCARGGDAIAESPLQLYLQDTAPRIGSLRQARAQHDTSPEKHTWQCVVPGEKGQFLFARPVNFHGVDLVLEAYDRDKDEKYDFALLYEYNGNSGELRPFPTRYIVIVGKASYEYVNMMGNGRCADIRSVEGNPGEKAGDAVSPGGPAPQADPQADEESCDMEEAPTMDKEA